MSQTLKVFATKLPLDWTESQAREYFSAQAAISDVFLFKDNGRSNKNSGLGCAYITFQSKQEAEEVIKKLSKEVSK